jgi:hypothetical protein
MNHLYVLNFIMSGVFILGETTRRGFSYMSINATTLFEDYVCGTFLIIAAILYLRKNVNADKFMSASWGYATGGMFVPFFAHLEAWMRVETFRADHPHEDLNGVIIKGVIFLTCLIGLVISLRNNQKIAAS